MGQDVRVLLSTYGGRGEFGPLVGLAVRLRALGAEVRVCAPPDSAKGPATAVQRGTAASEVSR